MYQEFQSQISTEEESTSVQSRSLWIGEIEHWMDENYIQSKFLNYGVQTKSVKIIKNRKIGVSLGYGFVEFSTQKEAAEALEKLGGKAFLTESKTFKLNWASDSESKVACMGSLPKNEFSIYVGNLNRTITEEELKNFFKEFYPSVISAKIIIDPITKVNKGYGFLRFSNQEESQKALKEMNGIRLKGCNISLR